MAPKRLVFAPLCCGSFRNKRNQPGRCQPSLARGPPCWLDHNARPPTQGCPGAVGNCNGWGSNNFWWGQDFQSLGHRSTCLIFTLLNLVYSLFECFPSLSSSFPHQAAHQPYSPPSPFCALPDAEGRGALLGWKLPSAEINLVPLPRSTPESLQRGQGMFHAWGSHTKGSEQ